MAISTAPEQTLQDTMGKLETALLSPVIAGEMKNWVRNVEQAAATFAMDWTRHLHSTVHFQYQEIGRTDPEMLPTVEKMIEADQQLLHDLAKFHEELHGLAQQAENVGWHESKLAGRQKHIEETGLQLILRIKKQQAATSTWLSEALNRDRGTLD